MARAFTVLGMDLTADPYRVTSTDAFSSPAKDITSQELARSDFAVALYRRIKSRTINVGGLINAADEVSCDMAIDSIKSQLLNGGTGNIAIGWGTGLRYWVGECQNLNISRSATDISRAAWSATLYCAKAFAVDGTGYVPFATAATLTTASNSIVVSNSGTYLATPVITLNVTSVTPSTGVDYVIGNPATNEYLTVTVVGNATITIDLDKKQVFVVGSTLTPVSGIFPAWLPGAGIMSVSDNGTARSISFSATYVRKYL